MRMEEDGPLIPVVWYQVPASRPLWNGRSTFRSRNYSDQKEWSGIGEQRVYDECCDRIAPSPYHNGAAPTAYSGDGHCGRDEAWHKGGAALPLVFFNTNDRGFPECCDPQPPVPEPFTQFGFPCLLPQVKLPGVYTVTAGGETAEYDVTDAGLTCRLASDGSITYEFPKLASGGLPDGTPWIFTVDPIIGTFAAATVNCGGNCNNPTTVSATWDSFPLVNKFTGVISLVSAVLTIAAAGDLRKESVCTFPGTWPTGPRMQIIGDVDVAGDWQCFTIQPLESLPSLEFRFMCGGEWVFQARCEATAEPPFARLFLDLVENGNILDPIASAEAPPGPLPKVFDLVITNSVREPDGTRLRCTLYEA